MSYDDLDLAPFNLKLSVVLLFLDERYIYCTSYGNIIEHWSQCDSFLSYLLNMAEEACPSASHDSASLFFFASLGTGDVILLRLLRVNS